MKRLLLSVLPALLVLCSCQLQAENENELDSMLSIVPLEAASINLLWLGDMNKIRNAADVGPDISIDDFINVEKAELQRRLEILAGYPESDYSGGSHLEIWADTYGFDALDTNQELWIQKITSAEDTAPFSIMQGEFDQKAIINKLENLGYELRSYKSTEFYSINEDYQIAADATQAPLPACFLLNRIMLTDKQIIAAPADKILFALIEGQAGKSQSIKEYPGYTGVIETLGDVLGAGIRPVSTIEADKEPEQPGLHNYDLVGIGYEYTKDEQKVVIVIHYPDNSAVNDIENVQKRITEYQVPGYQDKLLADLFIIGEPQVITQEADSLLKVELVYRAGTPRALWTSLIQPPGFLFNE
jgi:hypothetical protein